MSQWAGRRVFVTGANGFVGSWLTRELVQLGAHVVVLLRDITPRNGLALHPGVSEQITSVHGDLLDFGLVQRVIAEHEIDSVFHLAAQTIVGVSSRSPISTFETNVRGTWQLLEACRQIGTIRRIVIASSDKAYGDQPILPYTEDQALLGTHPYDASKVCTDTLARCYGKSFGQPVVTTRFANIYGGGDLNWSRIVPETMRALIENRRPVLRSDGTMVRDFLYVRDCVASYLLIGDLLTDRPELYGEAYNFGLGQPIQVIELVNTIIRLSGKLDLTPQIPSNGQPKQEIRAQYLDSSRAVRELAWRPLYTLEQGLAETMTWYTDHLSPTDSAVAGRQSTSVSRGYAPASLAAEQPPPLEETGTVSDQGALHV